MIHEMAIAPCFNLKISNIPCKNVFYIEVSNEQANWSSVYSSDSAYMTQLKRLNLDVCEWIKKHINENPYVDLSPVFKDYEKHLLNLEKKFPAVSKPAGLNEVMSTKVNFVSSPSVQAVRRPSSSVGMPTLNGSKFWGWWYER